MEKKGKDLRMLWLKSSLNRFEVPKEIVFKKRFSRALSNGKTPIRLKTINELGLKIICLLLPLCFFRVCSNWKWWIKLIINDYQTDSGNYPYFDFQSSLKDSGRALKKAVKGTQIPVKKLFTQTYIKGFAIRKLCSLILSCMEDEDGHIQKKNSFGVT